MPKLNIYNPKDHPGGFEQLRCEVGWERGKRVTLAVTRLADGADPTEEFLPPGTVQAGGGTITLTGGAVAVSSPTVASGGYQFARPGQPTATWNDGDGPQNLIPTWQGWHMELERSHINMLICELRKARDAAYGRDE